MNTTQKNKTKYVIFCKTIILYDIENLKYA